MKCIHYETLFHYSISIEKSTISSPHAVLFEMQLGLDLKLIEAWKHLSFSNFEELDDMRDGHWTRE
jgi:hypothetical protein